MKILVIKFSSIGDLTQALSIPAHIHQKYPQATIHFLTKNIFANLIENNPHVTKIWSVKSTDNFYNLIQLAKEMDAEKFEFIYDAHNNLRSNLFYRIISAKNKLQKPMERFKRFLLLNLKINKFEMPFSGQRDLLKPLEKWNIPIQKILTSELYLNEITLNESQKILAKNKVPKSYVVVAPSAAHAFKRWPVEKWQDLFLNTPHINYVVLAGPTDHFTAAFDSLKNVFNLTGQTTLLESAAVISMAEKVISNDTGLLHFAEQLQKKTIALMGAAPFGFPSSNRTVIIKKDLPCWPCSKHGQGPCTNPVFHKCMTDITVAEVAIILEKL